jgi:hypothetical protein
VLRKRRHARIAAQRSEPRTANRKHTRDRLRYQKQAHASQPGARHLHAAFRGQRGNAMICRIHASPIPEPLADPTRDPEGDPLTPPSPGHHNDEPQRPEGPPDKDPV